MLARDGYRCQLQLQDCTGQATQAHHVLGRSVTGDDMAHLVASCASCNRKVGDPTRANPQPKRVSRW